MDASDGYEGKRAKLVAELAAGREQGKTIVLKKSTSNLFRRRERNGACRIDVRSFNRVLDVDKEKMIADVEGMTTYETFVHETLRYSLLPTVVPQLKTITVGGAVSGIGIESSSFRFGLVHETVEEMEILLGDGSVMVCSKRENPDLFHGFPNSYGTLGYVLRLKVRLIPATPYVHLKHARFSRAEAYFAAIVDAADRKNVDYLDGTVFSRDAMYLTTGRFCREAPFVSDYTYMGVYYKSIATKGEDWLTAKDYIWRWDTDWFWCSKNLYMQNPVARFLATRWMLNSRTYQRVMRLAQRVLPDSKSQESVIQDVDIPIENAPEFLGFLLKEIGIKPLWICPFRGFDPESTFDLYALDPKKLYINFGFWDTIATQHEPGHFNRMVEKKALELEGKKGLYSSVYYDEETFWKIYNKQRYDELKGKYDPRGVFQNLYSKCAGRPRHVVI